MIPRIIHQTAPADRKLWHPIWFECQQSWQRNHPEYQYLLWEDADLRKLVASMLPDFIDIYDSFPAHIFRIDIARLFILKNYGGIYADMDFYCYKPFNTVLEKDKVSLVEDPSGATLLQNSLMASPKAHSFWDAAIEESLHYYDKHYQSIHDDYSAEHVIAMAGPGLLTRLYQCHQPDIHILNKSQFNPGNNGLDGNDIYSNHYLTGLWGCEPKQSHRQRKIGEPIR